MDCSFNDDDQRVTNVDFDLPSTRVEHEESRGNPTDLPRSLRKYAAKKECLRQLYQMPDDFEGKLSQNIEDHGEINTDEEDELGSCSDDGISRAHPMVSMSSAGSNQSIEVMKLTEELTATREALRQQEEVTTRLRREWNRAASEIRQLHSATGLQIDDNWLLGAWKELLYKIRDWSRQHFLVLPFRKIPPSRQYAFQGIWFTYDFEKVFEVDALRCVIMQHALWDFLVRRVFLTYPLWTDPKTATAYKDLIHRLKPKDPASPDAKQYHAWRAQTSALISHQSDLKEGCHRGRQGVQELADQIRDEFEYFSSKPEQLLEDLLVIISDCVKIDRLICQQRARYTVGPVSKSSCSSDFRPDSMEDMYGSSEEDAIGRTVAMKVSPLLYKVGTAAGEDYDKPPLVIAKANVVLKHTWRDLVRYQTSEMRTFNQTRPNHTTVTRKPEKKYEP